jgi:hypothetical protein
MGEFRIAEVEEAAFLLSCVDFRLLNTTIPNGSIEQFQPLEFGLGFICTAHTLIKHHSLSEAWKFRTELNQY